MRRRLAGRLAVGVLGPTGRTASGTSRAGCAPAQRSSSSSVEVSQDRLEQFLSAELWQLGQGGYSQIKIEQILEQRTPEGVAELIHKELPLRFASRLRQLERTSSEWHQIPGMRECHDMLMMSFRNLRLVDFNTSDLAAFTDVIRDLRHRHRAVVPLFAKAARGLKKMGDMTTKEVDDWLDKIMTSRMGTEMLTAHYMKLLTDPDDNHIGLVDTQCDPRKICKQAIEHTVAQFEGQDVPKIKLQVHGDIEFSFISEYLLFMVEELLLNAACATIAQARRRGSPDHLPDIHVTVCEDPRRIGIQISDKAGGIPRPEKRIWEYMFSTTPEDLVNHFREATPLSGPGMGLPMCRLYTQYLGGEMRLMSMPGIGTDVYIFLNRIDASGIVPPSIVDP